MLVIVVFGKAGSGKTTVAKIYQELLPDAEFCEVSELVRQHALGNERSISEQRSEEQRIALQDEIKHHVAHPDWLYDSIVATFPKKSNLESIMIVSGLRDPYCAYKLKSNFDTSFVKVIASDLIRYGRISTRDGWISIAFSRALDDRDSDLGLDMLMSYPHAYLVDGDMTLPHIRRRVTKQCFDNFELKRRTEEHK